MRKLMEEIATNIPEERSIIVWWHNALIDWPYQLVNSTGRYIAKNVCSLWAWNPRWRCSTPQEGCKKYHFPKEPPGKRLRIRYVSRYKIGRSNNLMASKPFVYTRDNLQKQDYKILLYSSTRSLGTLRAPTSSSRFFWQWGCVCVRWGTKHHGQTRQFKE